MTGIKLDFSGGEPVVVAPVSSKWGLLAELLDKAREGDEHWDEMDALIESIFPPRTTMDAGAVKTYLEYEALRERRINAQKEQREELED